LSGASRVRASTESLEDRPGSFSSNTARFMLSRGAARPLDGFRMRAASYGASNYDPEQTCLPKLTNASEGLPAASDAMPRALVRSFERRARLRLGDACEFVGSRAHCRCVAGCASDLCLSLKQTGTPQASGSSLIDCSTDRCGSNLQHPRAPNGEMRAPLRVHAEFVGTLKGVAADSIASAQTQLAIS